MKYLIFFIAFVVVCSGCDSDIVSTASSSLFSDDDEGCTCYLDSEPNSYELTVKLTINQQNKRVPLYIFNGNMEDGSMIWSDTVETAVYRADLDLNRHYTVVAKYLNDKDTVLVPVYFKFEKKSYECAGQA